MRRTFAWTVVAILIAGAATLGAQKKRVPGGAVPAMAVAADRTDASVAKLIQDLGDDDYKMRESAGRELEKLGERALPLMRTVLRETDSPEVQRRLAVMVRRMDLERLIAPKRITMKNQSLTAKAAIDELVKQTGYKIDFSGGGGGSEKFTFEFENTPFWVAIDKIASAAGCVVYTEYNDDSIRIYNQDSLTPYVSYSGPFRFVATNINSSDSIQLSGMSRRGGGNQRYSNMNLSFQIQSEPKNPMLGVTQVDLISAEDEFGGSLMMPPNANNRSNYYNNGSFRGHNTYGNVSLTRGDKSAKMIKTLKAKVGIMLLSGTSQEIAITDPLKVKKKTFVGRSIEIDFGSLVEDANTKGRYMLELTARKLGDQDPNRMDYNWGNTVHQRIELLDAKGNAYRTYGPNSSNNNGQTVQMTISYGSEDRNGNKPAEKLGPPVKMVVNEWHSITHEVHFEFKNIPLP